jgi:hypothetical protein
MSNRIEVLREFRERGLGFDVLVAAYGIVSDGMDGEAMEAALAGILTSPQQASFYPVIQQLAACEADLE